MEPRPTLYVLFGLPAAGKTTHARALEEDARALRLTPDEWMLPLFGEPDADGRRDVLEGRLVWLALRVLSLGVSVIADFGVWSRDERSALRWLAADAGAECRLVYLPVEEAEQQRRETARRVDSVPATVALDPVALRRSRAQFEEPDPGELSSAAIDPPPSGHPSWRSWASYRWPTSAG